MSTGPLGQVLGQASSDLLWLTTRPHTIDHVVVVAIENAARDQATAKSATVAKRGIEGDPDLGGRLGYPDPTGGAAFAAPDTSSAPADSAAVRAIDRALVGLDEACAELHRLVAGSVEVAPWTAPFVSDRGDLVASAVACIEIVIEAVDDVATLTAHAGGRVEHLIRSEIAEHAEWLRAKAEDVLGDAPDWARREIVQKPRRLCTSCARFGLEVDVNRYANKCDRCTDFYNQHHVQPTERICRRWDMLGNNSVTPTLILEAKAAARQRPGRGRKATG